jgi:hypothetical protein
MVRSAPFSTGIVEWECTSKGVVMLDKLLMHEIAFKLLLLKRKQRELKLSQPHLENEIGKFGQTAMDPIFRDMTMMRIAVGDLMNPRSALEKDLESHCSVAKRILKPLSVVLLKIHLRNTPLQINNDLRRQIGNLAQKLGIEFDTMLEFAREILHELIAEELTPREK